MKRILLIDDESVMTDSIQDRLADLHKNGKIGEYEAHSAHNFYKALDYLDKSPYDLLITDLLMPTYGLAPELLEQQRGVMLSGWTFLYHYVLNPDGEYYQNNLNAKCIFYSAYLDRLEKHWKDIGFRREEYKGRLFSVDKGNIFDDSGGFNKLMEVIEKLWRGDL